MSTKKKNLKTSKKKEEKRKPKYGMYASVKYVYRILWKHKRGQVFLSIVIVPVALVLSAIALFTPSIILAQMERADRFSNVALVIFGLLLAKLMFDLANNVIAVKCNYSEMHVFSQLRQMWNEKRRDRDWYYEYDSTIKVLDERAEKACEHNHVKAVHFPVDFANMVAAILKFVLFGSVISLLHPLIILLLALGCFVNYCMGRWERNRSWIDQDVRNNIDKKLWYSVSNIVQEYKYAKDIRLYSMANMLKNRVVDLLKMQRIEVGKMERRKLMVATVRFIIVMVRDGVAYGFLIYNAARGEMDASSFVLYFSAITAMADLMSTILQTFEKISEGALQLSDFREAMELEDKLNRGKGIPVPENAFTIEFKNVSFKYPKGEKKILNNVSFKINAGEKIALVGTNGAGKTTLTMLMCGLLLPDEGEILLDGHTLFEYNRDEMYGIFGFVPQDFHLLPFSIAKNIASAMTDEEVDYEKLQRCIKIAGLSEKIAALSNGVETPLNREVNEGGVDFSGGEIQKLLLARLLYKNPPCIILDEPTAALDPIAEDKMYRRYNEIAENATAIFISHRLASTRFCDRIFLLDNAEFAEEGTHEELMAAGGKYRELFDVQSKYYQEGETA